MDQDPITQTLELVRRAQTGNDEALNRLFERYYERVRRIVRLRLGRQLRSRLDSGDILQATFMSALNTFDNFEMRDEAAFIHWLSKIAEHQIRDAADYHDAQKRDRRKEVPLDAGADSQNLGFDPPASDPTPGDELSKNEQQVVMEQCLDDMPEEYRELIILRDYVGASWESIASQTGRPSPDAARMKHATALVELAKRVRKATQT